MLNEAPNLLGTSKRRLHELALNKSASRAQVSLSLFEQCQVRWVTSAFWSQHLSQGSSNILKLYIPRFLTIFTAETHAAPTVGLQKKAFLQLLLLVCNANAQLESVLNTNPS